MIPGVNFQPGQQSYGQQNGQRGPSRLSGGSPQGVQEAIKVLSLRLPKVVGARAVSPAPLLTSQGSGGNPNVDSIVESVLSRMFPGQQTGGPAPSAPTAPMWTPSQHATSDAQSENRNPLGNWFDRGDSTPPRFNVGGFEGGTRPIIPPLTTVPNVTVGTGKSPVPIIEDDRTGDGIKNVVQPVPDLRPNFDWLPQPDQWPDPFPMI